MTIRSTQVILWFVPVLCVAADAPGVTVTRWPGNRTAAVSLTFDDGMRTQLDAAGPLLRRHRLKATFFVTTGFAPWRERPDDWRRLAAEGHEIANHTVRHPCLSGDGDRRPSTIEAEVRDAAREIANRIGSRRGLAFAYPCGDVSLYRPYLAGCCFAARAGDQGGPQDPDKLDAMTAATLGRTDGRSAAELIAMLEPAVRGHAWGMYTFHGAGGEWLSVSDQALDGLAEHLERHPGIWTATFGDAIRYTLERRSLRITNVRSGNRALEADLEWPLDPAIFDVPLTLRIQLPPGWDGAQVRPGAAIKLTILRESGALILLAEVAPGTKQLEIERTHRRDYAAHSACSLTTLFKSDIL